MLKIVFGEVENAVYHPPTYFDNQYEGIEGIHTSGKYHDLKRTYNELYRIYSVETFLNKQNE